MSIHQSTDRQPQLVEGEGGGEGIVTKVVAHKVGVLVEVDGLERELSEPLSSLLVLLALARHAPRPRLSSPVRAIGIAVPHFSSPLFPSSLWREKRDQPRGQIKLLPASVQNLTQNLRPPNTTTHTTTPEPTRGAERMYFKTNTSESKHFSRDFPKMEVIAQGSK